MKIIGVCGKIGAGKDAVADYICRKHGFKKIVMSDLIIEEMKKIGRSVSRENIQKTTREFKAKHGKGIWAEKTIEHARERGFEKIVVTGLRDSEEIPIFRKEDFTLVFIDASPEVRFKRLIARGSKKDVKSIDELREQEK